MDTKKVMYELKNLDSLLVRKSFLEFKDTFPHPAGTRQGLIISYLIKNQDKPVYQRDLEKYLDIRRSTVSGILKTMEKNNLIIRKDSEVDLRLKEVILSEKVSTIYERSKDIFGKLEKQITKDISEEELNTFFIVIDKMKENLK